MPQGRIEIVEFRGFIDGTNKIGDVTTHLMALDGVFGRRYGWPTFGRLPSAWVRSYRIASFEVGRASSRKDFFEKCNEIFEAERPFERSSSTGLNTKPEEERSIRERMKALLDAVPDRPSRTLNDESEVEQYLDELSEVTAEDAKPKDNEFIIPDDAAVIFAELLSEPIERPLSLEFEISGYMALLSDEVIKTPMIEMPVAAAIANGLSTLVKEVKSSGNIDGEDYRHLQAAVRYFTVSEDANSDYDRGGFNDDAAVFNKVARRLGRDELVVRPSIILNR